MKMPHSRKPRKKISRPAQQEIVHWYFAQRKQSIRREDRRPLIEEDATNLSLAYHLAMETMVKGQSSEQDWSVVVCSLNIGLILCERGIGVEYESMFVAALDGAFRARLRGNRTGAWRFDGDALTAIQQALAVHDEQVKLATKEEMRATLIEVHRRITEGHTYQAEEQRFNEGSSHDIQTID
jgi:hypothetical protein